MNDNTLAKAVERTAPAKLEDVATTDVILGEFAALPAIEREQRRGEFAKR